AAMNVAHIKAEDGSAVLTLHAILHSRRLVCKRALVFNAGDCAAAASHSGCLISVIDIAMAVSANPAAGLAARDADQQPVAQGLPRSFQKSSRVPIWPLRLPLAVVTCPNSGLVMLV